MAPSTVLNINHLAGGSLGHGYAWEQIDLPRLSAAGVLLNLCNLAPLVKRRQVVVLHDASTRASPQAFSMAFRSAYRILMPAIVRRAAQLATVSEFSRAEMYRWFNVPRSRLQVCYEGGEHILANPADPSILDRHISGRYLLGVGMGPANKNLGLLLQAFSAAGLDNVQLVLTGRRSGRVHETQTLEFPPNVVYVGHVTDSELRALYQGAVALVYPSSYEGFGLPPLEAMACGCPVIISDQAALLEVAGDAAVVVKMNDRNALVSAIQQVAKNLELRFRLAELGSVRARSFTWRATAERLLEQCKAAAAYSRGVRVGEPRLGKVLRKRKDI
jgi:glycosyltransferase involved in cell wall biosynthesis